MIDKIVGATKKDIEEINISERYVKKWYNNIDVKFNVVIMNIEEFKKREMYGGFVSSLNLMIVPSHNDISKIKRHQEQLNIYIHPKREYRSILIHEIAHVYNKAIGLKNRRNGEKVAMAIELSSFTKKQKQTFLESKIILPSRKRLIENVDDVKTFIKNFMKDKKTKFKICV